MTRSRSTDSASLRALIGGKAAALVLARDAGLPVPAFFTLAVGEVRSLLAEDESAAAVRRRIESEYEALGLGRVAVRSSAQAEDGAASFAGQLASVLDVDGRAAILSAVRQVAASVHSQRAAHYSRTTRSGTGEAAVIVQRMVDATAAGVAFSRDPLTYQPEVVIESVRGAGEQLVSGRSTPARAVLSRADLSPIYAQGDSPLDAAALHDVAALTLECEQLFEAPQDIEWVWDADGLWLVQSRPLTGFEDVEVYSDTWSSEVWPGLIKPLVFDVGDNAVNAAWGRILTSVAGPMEMDWRRMSALAASRAYFNDSLLTAVLARAGLPDNTLESVVRGERPRLREGSLTRLVVSTGRLTVFLTRHARWLKVVGRELPSLSARIDNASAGIDELTGRELADRLDVLLEILEEAAYLSAMTTMSMGMRAALARLTVRALKGNAADVDTVTTAGVAPLRALADLSDALCCVDEDQRSAVRSGDRARIEASLGSTADGRRALDAMNSLMLRWGHIATVNTDFSTPAWRDEPAMLWRLALVSREAAPSAPPSTRDRTGWRRWIVSARLRSLERCVDAREEVNDALALAYDAWRKTTRAAGVLLSPSVLETPCLVYFLRLDELRAALRGRPAGDLGSIATERAAALEADAALAPPHRLWDLRLPPRDRMTAEARPRNGVSQFAGIPASPGVATGTARVLGFFDGTEALGADDILVVDHIDVGWTPLFTVVGGVITGAGGALSHAAIVARELGIPAVVAVPDATLVIPPDSRVRIDGTNGTVALLNQADEPISEIR